MLNKELRIVNVYIYMNMNIPVTAFVHILMLAQWFIGMYISQIIVIRLGSIMLFYPKFFQLILKFFLIMPKNPLLWYMIKLCL